MDSNVVKAYVEDKDTKYDLTNYFFTIKTILLNIIFSTKIK